MLFFVYGFISALPFVTPFVVVAVCKRSASISLSFE